MPWHIKQIPHFNPVPIAKENYEQSVPCLDLKHKTGDGLLTEAREYLVLCNQNIETLIGEHREPLDVHRIRSVMIDRLVTALFGRYQADLPQGEQAGEDVCALVATGGYGREEMSLLSDIDLLLVYNNKPDDSLSSLMKKILYVLWDLKFDIGHAIRTLKDCEMMMLKEHTVMTSLLDLRLIAGSRRVFNELVEIRDRLLSDHVFIRRLIQSKINEREFRLDKYGGSVYLLEPHIKEGEGGLRDLQMIRWLARIIDIRGGFYGLETAGYINDVTAMSLTLALSYLLNLRNRLHLLTRAKNDQLSFNAQISIARDDGFTDDNISLGVEKFMQNYYAIATQNNINVKNLVQKILSGQKSFSGCGFAAVSPRMLDEDFKVLDGKIAVIDDEVFHKKPHALLAIFEHVQKTGQDLHFHACELVAQNIFRVDDSFRRDPVICDRFKKMLASYENLGKTMFAMHEVHFFDALIPAFQKIRNRVHYDAYHVYTVDTHSIFALNEISRLYSDPLYEQKFPSFKKALLDIKQPDLLSLGLLLHDIGKGEGRDHSIIGAKIAREIVKGLGYAEDACELVEFQVLSHLTMPHLSQRRDLEDYHMVKEFAKAVKSMRRLNLLYVLTWADIRAVSPEAWTEWKGNLLEKLYQRTRDVIVRQEKYEDVVQRRLIDIKKAVMERSTDSAEADQLYDFLKSIAPRYVLAHSFEEINQHFKMLMNHNDDNLFFLHKEIARDVISEVVIYTWLNPRVFPLVTGVMLSLDINILSMENFTFTDGHVFIKMKVQSRDKHSLIKAGLVETLKKNLNDVFMGRTTVSTLLANRRSSLFLRKKVVGKIQTRVNTDNDVSGYYTVIDVFTYDRIGLLYDMVTCLVEQGCYLDVSKISTNGDQVIDSFYVKDIFGQKIKSKEKLDDIKKALLSVLDA
ncbi:MAG: [protein-PII] uridylyltransferase [Deltaproteobacteria bacterium]|nr:[protein-PII] uridylyltransferase [Deltaproteobacteria bacterium]